MTRARVELLGADARAMCKVKGCDEPAAYRVYWPISDRMTSSSVRCLAHGREFAARHRALLPARGAEQPAAEDLRNAAMIAYTTGQDLSLADDTRQSMRRVVELIQSALEKLAEPNQAAISVVRRLSPAVDERTARDFAAAVVNAAVVGP